MVQLFVSVLLFFVLFFGIAFILNMLLRATWIMSLVYPVVVLLIVDEFPFSRYFSETGEAFRDVFENLASLTTMDIIILSAGFLGTIGSGIVIKMLRKNGYQMF